MKKIRPFTSVVVKRQENKFLKPKVFEKYNTRNIFSEKVKMEK